MRCFFLAPTPAPASAFANGIVRRGAPGPRDAQFCWSSSSSPSPGEYLGFVGEYAGEVGEYAGDVGEYAGEVGEYAGDVGEYAGEVGE